MKPRKRITTGELFLKELLLAPVTFPNGSEAHIQKAKRPWPNGDEPLSEMEYSYLFIRFPVALSQREKIRTLRVAEHNYKTTPADIPNERARASNEIIYSAGSGYDRLAQELEAESLPPGEVDELLAEARRYIFGNALSRALRHKHGDNKTASQIQKEGQKRRGPGSDKMQESLQKRDAWARKRFSTLLRDKMNSRPYAIEALMLELKQKKFGIWHGSELKKKTIRKIVAGITRPLSSK